MRILCHAQSSSGVGHAVRMRAIARGLSRTHEVSLVDGGRPMPADRHPTEPDVLELPRLFRVEGRLSAAAGPGAVPDLLEERARILARAVEAIRPDIVLIEHYPFSKWEIGQELTATIEAARRANAGARVLCSLRDVVPKTRYEAAEPARYEARVLALLQSSFDAVLVHTDPAFTRLEQHFRRTADLPVPVHYTGFAVDPFVPRAAPPWPAPYAVLSCGGGARSLAFLLAAVEAFRRLSAQGRLGAMPLFVFPGPSPGADEAEALRVATRGGPFHLRDFSPDFSAWLAGSALSISRAGYNTSSQILQVRARSVLVPDPDMSDQEPRAMRLAELGLATVVEGRLARVEGIAAAIETALARPPARPELDLDGVEATRAILEKLGTGDVPGPSRPRGR